MNFTLDTYAWIEYFEGTSQGESVKEIVENEEHTLFTPSIVLAELADAVAKGRLKINFDGLAKFISFNSQIKEITPNIAKESGLIKNALRKKHSDVGLIDSIILATSLETNSKLLTGDPHLVGEKDVIDIRKI